MTKKGAQNDKKTTNCHSGQPPLPKITKICLGQHLRQPTGQPPLPKMTDFWQKFFFCEKNQIFFFINDPTTIFSRLGVTRQNMKLKIFFRQKIKFWIFGRGTLLGLTPKKILSKKKKKSKKKIPPQKIFCEKNQKNFFYK